MDALCTTPWLEGMHAPGVDSGQVAVNCRVGDINIALDTYVGEKSVVSRFLIDYENTTRICQGVRPDTTP